MKKILFFACLLAVCVPSLNAQTKQPPRIVHTAEKSAAHVPPQAVPASFTLIYNNLYTQTDLYDDTSGWSIAGPAAYNYSFFSAIPFTPRSNAHVLQARAAVHYFSGANRVDLSIYSDANGIPGELLAGPVTVRNLPNGGTCCALAVADFTPLAVTAGTQYWLVVDTPLTGTGSDFSGEWDMVARIVPIAFNGNGFGWSAGTANDLPAAAVLGTVQ